MGGRSQPGGTNSHPGGNCVRKSGRTTTRAKSPTHWSILRWILGRWGSRPEQTADGMVNSRWAFTPREVYATDLVLNPNGEGGPLAHLLHTSGTPLAHLWHTPGMPRVHPWRQPQIAAGEEYPDPPKRPPPPTARGKNSHPGGNASPPIVTWFYHYFGLGEISLTTI